jgi:hypothetical protein
MGQKWFGCQSNKKNACMPIVVFLKKFLTNGGGHVGNALSLGKA